MLKTDNGTGPGSRPAYRLPERGPRPDLPLYERLIENGIAAADSRGTIVDHITARRLAIWLAARPPAAGHPNGHVMPLSEQVAFMARRLREVACAGDGRRREAR